MLVLIHSSNLCPLIDVFIPFLFIVIIDMVGLKSTLPFLFSVCEYTSFPLSGRKRGGVWLHKVWEAGPGAPFPSLRLLAGLVVLRPRAKALCVLQEGAHGWLVDDE